MQRTAIWIATVALGALAGCGSSGNAGEPPDRSDTAPAASETAGAAPVLLDTEQVEQDIRQKFLRDYAPAHPGDSLSNVFCPEDVSGTVGDETTCDIDFSDGSYGRMTLKVTDDKGNFDLVGASKS